MARSPGHPRSDGRHPVGSDCVPGQVAPPRLCGSWVDWRTSSAHDREVPGRAPASAAPHLSEARMGFCAFVFHHFDFQSTRPPEDGESPGPANNDGGCPNLLPVQVTLFHRRRPASSSRRETSRPSWSRRGAVVCRQAQVSCGSLRAACLRTRAVIASPRRTSKSRSKITSGVGCQ